MNDPL